MGFLDQTTLSSLSSVTIVFSILFSSLCLGEPFNRWVFLQLLLMLSGSALMLVFSNKVEREFTLDVSPSPSLRTCSFSTSAPLRPSFSLPTPPCSSFSPSLLSCGCETFTFRIVKKVLQLKKVYDESAEHLESD